MKLKINIWTGILDIINAVVFSASWFVIFSTAFSDAANGSNSTDGASTFFYVMAGIGLVLNIIALIQSKKHGISIVGSVLGLIGNALFLVSGALAFPAIVLLIIGTVFIFLQHPAKKSIDTNNSNNQPA
ncbi:transporter [Pediococcus acidilactici]|uniref:transporter n=1 Tax=Pediococcus acidilactici TaxID=1254 RepID=UPI000FF533C5|nr:transporter [Pediococcus acidilactici]RWY85761.1 transporter [Pediococcus acidilactici]